jgi:hypothetical protein
MTKPFTLVAAAIFLLMALAHLYRLIAGFPVTVAGHELGQGISIFALVLTAVLSVGLLREARR